ncbi:MAG: hypothetical protein PWQ25_2036 [Deferribacteres bacterium]|jgi:uncharacterized protein (DUF169 family)|nr:hypothetical protein [Deferribacteraceae bacterium]MDK2793173.1 hypothetical protein [Deferribacteres bacterium]
MINLFEELNKYLRLQTIPVGVNLLKELPELKVKVKDKKLTVCQQIAYSRYYGWSTIATKEFSYCVLGASCAGLIKTPERVIEGTVNCNIYQKDKDAAKYMQQNMPRINEDIKAVLTYPLNRPIEGIEPDVVVFYCNTAQAMRMVQAFLYEKGGQFDFSSSGDAGVCSRAVAETYIKGKPVIEIPCLGDRRFAMTQDFELAVGFPYKMKDEIINGLKATHKAGIRYPIPFQIPEGCDLPFEYTTQENDLN